MSTTFPCYKAVSHGSNALTNIQNSLWILTPTDNSILGILWFLLVKIFENKRCPFYRVPEHGHCHGISRRIQTFYVMRLSFWRTQYNRQSASFNRPELLAFSLLPLGYIISTYLTISYATIPGLRCAHPEFLTGGGGGRLTLRVYAIYVGFQNVCYKNHVVNITET
jgi:hypothetical protein